jgi:hypothetical protein
MLISQIFPLGPKRSDVAEGLLDFIDAIENRTVERFPDDPLGQRLIKMKCTVMRHMVYWHPQMTH